MITAFIAGLLALIIPVIAYIPYKYPFNNEKGQITKWARFFGWLVFISFLLGIYLAFDAYKTNQDNTASKKSLQDTVSLLNHNVNSLGRKIDSVGFKIDKTSGKLVQKTIKIIPIKTVISYKETNNEIKLSENQLASMFDEVETDVKKDTGIKRITIYKEDYSNAPYVTAQIRNYFNDKGYNARILPIAFGGGISNETIQGAKITVHTKSGIWIRVGYFK
jgi:hypothetical protein